MEICNEWNPINKSEYQGVWVHMELDRQGIREASLQLLSIGRKLADKLKTYLAGVLIGSKVSDLLEEPIYYGADKVLVFEDDRLLPYYPSVHGAVLVNLVRRFKPELLLISGTMKGRELAPYVANCLRTGITADCTSLDVDQETGDVIQIRPPFGAWMLAHIRTPNRRPQIATVRPNVFDLPKRDENRRGEIIKVPPDLELPSPGMELLESELIRREETPLEKADVIVSGGRGLGSAGGFKLIKELADLLGGVVAGSRKAVEAGWISQERQVGQTGRSVKPNLYIAVGISGAAQHVFGIREARCVVAVNRDPEAPIFQNSDYGVVCDYKRFVPLLIEEIKKRKNSPVGHEVLSKEITH